MLLLQGHLHIFAPAQLLFCCVFPPNDEILSDFSSSFSGERIRWYKTRFLLFVYMMYSSMTVAK